MPIHREFHLVHYDLTQIAFTGVQTEYNQPVHRWSDLTLPSQQHRKS